MKRLPVGAGAAALAGAAGLALWVGAASEAVWIDAEDAALVARGRDVYVAQCASCHGGALEGAPEWRTPGPDGRFPAPPHDETGHTWHHADQALFDYVKLGGDKALARIGVEDFESEMPAFGDVLSDEEIRAVLAYIKASWPDEIQEAQRARDALARQ